MNGVIPPLFAFLAFRDNNKIELTSLDVWQNSCLKGHWIEPYPSPEVFIALNYHYLTGTLENFACPAHHRHNAGSVLQNTIPK